MQGWNQVPTRVVIESFDRVDRPQHLRQRTGIGSDVEPDAVPISLEAMNTRCETMAVDLVAVAKTWLRDPSTPVDLIEQPMDIGDQVGIDLGEMCSHDGTEQEPAKSGRRIGGQHEVTQRDPTRGCRGARVPHLELSEQHGRLQTCGLSSS